MHIETKKQETSNEAEATIRVGCGINGDEGNEPAITYVINPDGLTLHRETDKDEQVGYAKLNLQDLDAICGVAGMSYAEVLECKKRIFKEEPGVALEAPGVSCFQGELAVARMWDLLNAASQPDATGKVWVLPCSSGSWEHVVDLSNFVEATFLNAEMVVIDSGNTHGDAWKYTYYSQSKVGLFIYESP